MGEWKGSEQAVHDGAFSLADIDLWTALSNTRVDDGMAYGFHNLFASWSGRHARKLHLFDDIAMGTQGCINDVRTGVFRSTDFKALDAYHHPHFYHFLWPAITAGAASPGSVQTSRGRLVHPIHL